MRLDVLAIGAHPDDVELTCAGTLIKLSKKGRTVGVLDLTEGELGTRGSRETRKAEAERAGGIMGLAVRRNLRLPDGNIIVNQENILSLVKVLREHRPEILIFPYGVDRHPDHEHAFTLCKEAWFYAGLEKIETSLSGNRQSPHRAGRYFNFMQWTEFQPTFIVDVTDEFPVRLEAIRAYMSQFHDPRSTDPATALSDPSFLEMIQTRARYYGDRIGAQYGEPFYFHRTPGVTDLQNIV